MLPPDNFATPRLRARRIDEGDLDYMVRVDTDPAMQAMLTGTISTREQSRARLGRWLEEARATGLGFWLFFDDRAEPIGHGGLFSSPRDPGFTELGYAIVTEHWGRGYATEMAGKLRGIARSISLPPLIGMTRATNAPSRRVLEKTGFRYDRNVALGEIEYARYVEDERA